MVKHLNTVAVLIASLVLFFPGRAHGGVMTSFDLGSPAVSATAATFNVSVTFTGTAGDTIEAIQLSVLGSDPLLTVGGTDFSRFSFNPNGATLPGWLEFSPLSTGVGLYAPFDPLVGPFLFPSFSPYDLGTLVVDLTGLPGGSNLLVTLVGDLPGLDTDAGGTVGGALVPSFASAPSAVADVTFADPVGVRFTTPDAAVIPEPSPVILLGLGTLGLLGYGWRRQKRTGA